MPAYAEVYPLFNIPVFKIKVNEFDFDKANKDLEELEYERTNHGDGWMTKEQSLLTLPQFSEAEKVIRFTLQYYLYEVLKVKEEHQPKHVCSWGIYHDVDDWCFDHLHTNSLFSGVFYTNVHENSGEFIEFCHTQSIPTWCPSTLEPGVSEFNLHNSKSWKFKVQQGDMILFPSHVLHQVPVSKTTEKRRSISFNYFLTGKFGLKTAYAEFT